MKLHHLEALVAVADTGSIRAAARLIAISQTAVSKALRELENTQRMTLLMRAASGVTFTEAGQKLLSHARQVIGQLQRAEEEMAEMRGEHIGQLSIAVTPWVMRAFVPATLERFRTKMPDVQVELFEGLSAVALPRLRDGALDFAVVPLIPAMPEQEFENEPLVSFNTYVVARPDHPAVDARSIGELLAMNWAVNFTVSTYPAQMQDLFWQHGFDIEPRRLHCAHSASFLFDLIGHADMIGPCPAPLIISGPGTPLVRLELKEALQPKTVGIIKRRNAVSSASARCFIECLVEVIRQRARSSRREDTVLFDALKLLI
ncbi:DNA-binding transcriptional LysR family regulator [Paraburkholderia eburnea]|uniref:DNA-binding transcriptional LysR family regulator n=1 Tax=Paraburkholderia eburnea TaxID=1189126 RepID=A0A2S4LWS3_9BURK|nr:LysR substrate-binding domain-containing protein [Paraburkholderia eburnea]POR46901.1 DNA-binding transcriptional LysR family regulator [Paraburkholderia eburnea]PRZ18004.1 DNA-binding transcriptional LysR family regulator [Paraburkholderia eburnea]